MNIVVVAFDHQSTCSVPDYVMMHGTVRTRANLIDGGIEASTVLDYVVDPVVGDFSTWCFALHHLDNSSIGLQMTDIPHFVVEDLGCITNGQHRRGARQVNAIVGEIHVTPTFVNGGHQSLLVSS